MKKFKVTHLVFGTEVEFNEDEPPTWLIGKEFGWWWYDFILMLEVGESKSSDFQKIERVE